MFHHCSVCSCLQRVVNKTNTVVDFFHMIFKITIQNCQTSNTSASLNNRDNITKHSESSSKQESSWGWDFPKTKTRDTDVILSPSYPQSESIVLCGPRRRRPGWDLGDETCVRQVSNYYV